MKQWQSKNPNTQRMGTWRKLSVSLVAARGYPGAKFTRNPSSQQLHIGWIWEASKKRWKDSHSFKVPSDSSWNFKGSHNTRGYQYTSFGIRTVKSNNGITSQENKLSLEGMEQHRAESNRKGEEHLKGMHPSFHTKALPSEKQVRLPPPQEGSKADSLHVCLAALPGERQPVVHLLSSPASNTRAQRLGGRCVNSSGWQHSLWQPLHSTVSRWSWQAHGPLHGLSRAPDPSGSEQNSQ